MSVLILRHAGLGQVMEPTRIPDFLASCVLELRAVHAMGKADEQEGTLEAADAANDSTLPRPWLVARCLLFAELATSWVGWTGLRPFFEDLLCEERYRALVAIEREMAGL